MKIYDVVLLTDKRYLKDSKTNTYKHNVYYEDFLVLEALREKKLNVKRLAWDDANFNWASTRTVLFRTTWDYFDRYTEFSKWLSSVSKKTILLNSEKLIRWNIDKHYLKDLYSKNIPVAETFFIEKGTAVSLTEIYKKCNWADAILKPCISGAARHTYKLNAKNLKNHEAIFSKLIKSEAMMLQPFQYNIVSHGELSLMVFNGKFTHAVLKKAKAGDFRVQDDFGGTIHNYQPTANEIQFAENATKACPELPIYARVDIFTDNAGNLAVSELELIEPELWFRNYPKSAVFLASCIQQKLKTLL